MRRLVVSTTDRRSYQMAQLRRSQPSRPCSCAQVLLAVGSGKGWLCICQRPSTLHGIIHNAVAARQLFKALYSRPSILLCRCRHPPRSFPPAHALTLPLQPWSHPRWRRWRQARSWASSSDGLASSASHLPAPRHSLAPPAAWRLHRRRAPCSIATLQVRGRGLDKDQGMLTLHPWCPQLSALHARCRLLLKALTGLVASCCLAGVYACRTADLLPRLQKGSSDE